MGAGGPIDGIAKVIEPSDECQSKCLQGRRESRLKVAFSTGLGGRLLSCEIRERDIAKMNCEWPGRVCDNVRCGSSR